jgi:hypothetical protein
MTVVKVSWVEAVSVRERSRDRTWFERGRELESMGFVEAAAAELWPEVG